MIDVATSCSRTTRRMLLDLPDTLLAAVGAWLPDESILAAALSCRRLNTTALRVFFARNDIPDPSKNCEVYFEGENVVFSVLRALNLATFTFLHSTERLSLIFLNADLSLGLQDMRGAAALIGRLHIDSLSLEFQCSICENGIKSELHIQKQWNTCFTELWMAVLRSSAISVSVRATWDFLQSYMLYSGTILAQRTSSRPVGAITRSLTALRHRMQQLDTSMSVRRVLSHLPPAKNSRLASLHIENGPILLPALYHLALATFQYCPVAALKLHSGTLVAKRRNMANDIGKALPSLAQLTIVNVDVPSDVLCRFLSRFPDLTTLSIEAPAEYHDSQTGKGLIHLPRRLLPHFNALTELSLTSAYLVGFLRRPEFIAHVERLNITMPMSHLCLPQLLDDLAPLKTCNAHICLRLNQFHLLERNSVFMEMQHCIDVALGLRAKWLDAFGRVGQVSLVPTQSSLMHLGTTLPRWLALFPAARRFTWDEYSSDEFPRVLARPALYSPGGAAPSRSTASLQFSDLPDDIITTILDFLGTQGLFNLALISRRLNYLTIPVLLSNGGIWDRETSTCTIKLDSLPAERDSLAMLTIALILPEIKQVQVRIPRTTYIYPSLNHVRRLISVLERFSALESASIHLGIAFKTHLEAHHVFLQQQWCVLFERLVNTVVSKPTCTTLRVQGSPLLYPDEVAWNQQHPPIPLNPPPATNLTFFGFQPSGLLSPMFEPWTIALLRNSKITAMRLEVNAPEYRFVDVIPQTSPHLRELDIQWLLAPEKNLRIAKLLSLLPQLEKLRMSSLFADSSESEGATASGKLTISPPAPHLRNLKALAASVPYINHLLQTPNALPVLQTLEISVLLASPDSFSPQGITPPGGLSALFNTLHRRGLSPVIILTLIFRAAWDRDPEWPRLAFDAAIGPADEDGIPHPNIVALKVKIISPYTRSASSGVGYDSSAPFVGFLRDRLRISMFRTLNEVSFDDGIEYKSDEQMRGAVQAICEIIRGARPDVEGVWVNGKNQTRPRDRITFA
ncbi:hypothetical protein MKEN_01217100 [Mycena kentingensis (nom. inval.)]|nr:hypothetical protein MKEN_01217100 [Mycena kentingensis (nom. inval.)]